MWVFSKRSIEKLKGVRPELVLLASRALMYSPIDFAITHGVRTPKEQKKLVKEGKSRTMNSKHMVAKAIDVAAYVDGVITWEWDAYILIADAFKRASEEMGIPINCGVDWKDFPDGCHVELE